MKTVITLLLLSLTCSVFANEPEISYKSGLRHVAMGFIAKEMCSCLFVMKRSRQECDQYIDVKQDTPVKYQIDYAKKSVMTHVFFIFRRRASYRGELYGCSLE